MTKLKPYESVEEMVELTPERRQSVRTIERLRPAQVVERERNRLAEPCTELAPAAKLDTEQR